jgi:type I restriction enzyme S subunit
VIGSKATIAHLPGVKLKALRIPIPDMALQQRFVYFTGQSDKSKYSVNLKQTLFIYKLKFESKIQEEELCSLKM